MLEILEQILDHKLLPIAAVILAVTGIMIAYSKATRKERFEEKIATSKVNAISVGLVEIVGNVRPIKQCKVPLFERECVGYSYKIERIRTNSDRRDSYHAKYTENFIEPFFIEDDTGKVLIEPDSLVADSLPQDYKYKLRYRHSCAYLNDGDKVMVIGRAQPRNGKLVVQRDEKNNIFTLTPFSEVVQQRAMNPLISRFFLYFLVATVVTALLMYF